MSIKNILIALFTMIVILAVYKQFNPTTEDDIKRIVESVMENNSQNQDNIELSELSKHLIDNEPKVLDAYINDAGYLYVQVVDDGTNRNGYASYICQEARAVFPTVKVNMVRVMKVNTFNHPDKFNAYGIRLGEYRCN